MLCLSFLISKLKYMWALRGMHFQSQIAWASVLVFHLPSCWTLNKLPSKPQFSYVRMRKGVSVRLRFKSINQNIQNIMA